MKAQEKIEKQRMNLSAWLFASCQSDYNHGMFGSPIKDVDRLTYRLATPADVDALVDLRAAFLAEVSTAALPKEVLRAALTAYFVNALPSREFVAYVALVGDRIVATSGLVYHRGPPSVQNLHGCEAYVMNMYTRPEWRARGIATALLNRLVEHARQNNCCRVSLHALPKARAIYSKSGFAANDTEMRLELQ